MSFCGCGMGGFDVVDDGCDYYGHGGWWLVAVAVGVGLSL